MAKKKKQRALKAGTNPLAEVEDELRKDFQRPSSELIYETVMRSGGEPFGAPYEVGTSSLTERIVKFFKQRSFFGFETFEKMRPKRRRNRFTRHGASRYLGEHDTGAAKLAWQQLAQRKNKEKKR